MLKRAMAVAALWLALATCSSSTSLAAESASVQPVLESDGGGEMIANSQTNPDDETWSWESCTIDLAACAPFASGRIVETTGAPVPSVFRVTSSYGATTLSPRWNGPVSPVSPPSVVGSIRANELVMPISGQWQGGWAGDVNWTQLAACEGPNDEGCTTLTHRHYPGGYPNGAAVIDPKFTGMYLRVAVRRIPANTPELAYAVGSPYTPDIWHAGPTIAVAIVGRIAPATDSPPGGHGPAQLVQASISRRGVATVRCALGCQATLVARQGKRRAFASRRLSPLPEVPPKGGPKPKLRLGARQLKRFTPGSIRFVLRVDGKRVTRRTVHISVATS